MKNNKILLELNPSKVNWRIYRNYLKRQAVRAVIFNPRGRVALLYVKQENYYKLPGGGIEQGESLIKALRRECLEEAGAKIRVVNTIGKIHEIRKIHRLNQTSICYIVKTVGRIGKTNFTADEKKHDFRLIWLSYKSALRRLNNTESKCIEARHYITPRDITFLKATK